MAERRMFSTKIVDSDAFLDMPQSTQNLYFHLSMRADDDGFVGNPKKIMRSVGASDDDYKILVAKRFILIFQSGVCVIKHWLIHNLIRADRYNETQYLEEKRTIKVKQNKAYTEETTECQPDGNQMATQVRLGKDRLGKVSIGREEEKVAVAPALENVKKIEVKKVKTEEVIVKKIHHFEDPVWFENIVTFLFTATEEKVPRREYENEMRKFISYWTEKSDGAKKCRWEKEKVFDVKKRVATWMRRFLESKNNNYQNKYQTTTRV